MALRRDRKETLRFALWFRTFYQCAEISLQELRPFLDSVDVVAAVEGSRSLSSEHHAEHDLSANAVVTDKLQEDLNAVTVDEETFIRTEREEDYVPIAKYEGRHRWDLEHTWSSINQRKMVQ